MKCPFCGSSDLKVIDKRQSDDESNRRRRECLKCNKRFTTYERVEMVEIKVEKKDGRRESFNRDKILKGVIKACEKRPISQERIEATVDEIEAELLSMEEPEIKSTVIGDVVMAHLKKLDEIAFIRFASVYRAFEDLSEFESELKNLKVVSSKPKSAEVHETNLLVSTSVKDNISTWDRARIKEALINEISITDKDADEIARNVESKVVRSGVKIISTSFLRELVNNELFERGLTKKLEKQEILGINVYNLNQLIYSKDQHQHLGNPEIIRQEIAAQVFKNYALKEVFSKDVAESHLTGSIHIHDLGHVLRFYSLMFSPEYIKKFGLQSFDIGRSPAKHASSLTSHIINFLSSMQSYYYSIGLSDLNITYAPLLYGLNENQVFQEAQHLIFNCNSLPKSSIIELHIYAGIPKHLENIPAIGTGGRFMIKKDNNIEYLQIKDLKVNYSDPDPKPKKFLAYKDFDIQSLSDQSQVELAKLACKVVSNKRPLSIVLDNHENNFEADSGKYDPDIARCFAIQNISINLPQASYKGKTIEGTVDELRKTMDIIIKAHAQKKSFISKTTIHSGWQTESINDDKSFIDLDDANFNIGLIGLNECIRFLTGKSMHESDESYKLGLKIAAAIYIKANELEQQHNMKITLSEKSSESCNSRFAKNDLKEYPEAKELISGNNEDVYYTGSINFSADASIDLL